MLLQSVTYQLLINKVRIKSIKGGSYNERDLFLSFVLNSPFLFFKKNLFAAIVQYKGRINEFDIILITFILHRNFVSYFGIYHFQKKKKKTKRQSILERTRAIANKIPEFAYIPLRILHCTQNPKIFEWL